MTSFGVRPTFRSEAAKRIEAAGRAFAEKDGEQRPVPGASRAANGDVATGGPGPGGARGVVSASGSAAGGAPLAGNSPFGVRQSPTSRNPGACRRIIEEVAVKHDIPVRDILSDRRARVLIPARHEAIWRCVMETPLSLPAIGRVFHRDHTSVGHAVMRHHLTTGDPLPRGMDWKAGRRKRRPDAATAAVNAAGAPDSAARGTAAPPPAAPQLRPAAPTP